jgi:polyisoprenoid-binding protein YceI
VAGKQWKLDASDGQLLVRTGVTGCRASRLGHRLTIALNSWRAAVSWMGDRPCAVDLNVDVESLEVLRGDGGLTALSGPEKALARSNALKSLGANRFRTISFRADEIAKTAEGYRLSGTLEIHGTPHPRSIDLRVEDLDDVWRMSCDAEVRQTEFGVKPFSMFMGSMKVADDVTVSFTGTRAKGD